MKIGKLLGKAVGQIIAAPVTVAAEIVEAAETAIDESGKAIGKGWDRIEGRE